jgi:hypothetical protein
LGRFDKARQPVVELCPIRGADAGSFLLSDELRQSAFIQGFA